VTPRPWRFGPRTRPALLLFVALALPSAPARSEHDADALPPYRAADADAPVVTELNLPASDRFWPREVALTRAFRPAEARPLAAGSTGVLIRVEDSGVARVDFGRDGLYEVPVGDTDLVEHANRIRRGDSEKDAPNFLYSIAPRLGDAASAEPRAFPYGDAAEHRLFLAVFADPGAPDFGALAKSLAPLRGRSELLTILFPQGRHPDIRVREQLRELEWTVPFVYDHLAEPYTNSLIGDASPSPYLTLQSADGRVLFRAPWKTDAASELLLAIDAVLGRTSTTASMAEPAKP
jgi:hypothetical protein